MFFASLLGRAVEEQVFKQKTSLTTKSNTSKLKKDPTLFKVLLQNKGDSKIKLLVNTRERTGDKDKDTFFLQQ